VEKAVQRTGYADFWELRSRNAIPRETTNYVPIILAMTIMAKNPKAYGLDDIEVDPPLTFDTVKLDAPTHLALVADLVDRPVPELRELNPALLRNVAPAGYDLKVPQGSSESLLAGLKNVPETRRASWRVHRVISGETLAGIARRYRTSVTALSSANENAVDAIAGNLLVVPAAAERDNVVRASKATRKMTRAKSSHATAKTPEATASKSRPATQSAAATPKRSHRRPLLERASLR
jgi:membrane-bound lytic murein transglycosylase D